MPWKIFLMMPLLAVLAGCPNKSSSDLDPTNLDLSCKITNYLRVYGEAETIAYIKKNDPLMYNDLMKAPDLLKRLRCG